MVQCDACCITPHTLQPFRAVFADSAHQSPLHQFEELLATMLDDFRRDLRKALGLDT
jgi:hypothetical protein